MIEHTPGPWKLHSSTCIGTNERDFQTIAYADDHRNRVPRPEAEQKANARLIAAAPELLAAIEDLLIYGPGDPAPDGVIRSAVEAIAKAKGISDKVPVQE